MTEPIHFAEIATDFDEWVNINPSLDSYKMGLTRGDIDLTLYHVDGNKLYCMLIEEKTHGHQYLKSSQEVTAQIIHKSCQSYTGTIEWRGQPKDFVYWGFYVVVFSNTRPDNSNQILMRHLCYGAFKQITVPELELMLSFKQHPMTLLNYDYKKLIKMVKGTC